MNEYQIEYESYLNNLESKSLLLDEVEYYLNIRLKSIREQWKYDFAVQYLINIIRHEVRWNTLDKAV